jgi:hypothetical protein
MLSVDSDLQSFDRSNPMATTTEAMHETSPLLPNDRDSEVQVKSVEEEKTRTIESSFVTGIGFMWLASFLAAAGRSLASYAY